MVPPDKTIETSSQVPSLEITQTINDIARGINLGETVVFCGAGISSDSGLPMANQFIPYVLLTLCASQKEIQRIEENLKVIQNPKGSMLRLIGIINEKIKASEDVINKIMDDLPFEAFIELLHRCSEVDKIFDIYDADKYLPAVEPNTNHTFLAKLIKLNRLKTIVTTNFDQLIEKALKLEGMIEGKDYDLLSKDEDFEKINWAQDRVRLIKIHGSIHEKAALAITLSQVAKKELSEARARIVDYVYSQGRHKQVLILGYSCSDLFDLSLQIETIQENQKKVFLVQHSDHQGIKDVRLYEGKNPFRRFANSTRLYCNTDQLVGALWRSIIHGTYGSKKSDTNWKEKVAQWYSESTRQRTKALPYTMLGLLLSAIKEYAKAIEYHEEALNRARAMGNKEGEGTSLGHLGTVYFSLGEYPEAIEYHEEALAMFRAMGNKQGEGTNLGHLGLVYFSLGEYHEAIEYHEQALNMARAIGDQKGEGTSLGHLGTAYSSLGKYPKAIEYHEQALNIARAMGNKQGEGNCLGHLGTAYNNIGEYPKAIEYHEEALNIARAIGDQKGEENCLGNLGTAYNSLGEYTKAIEYSEQALSIARATGDKQDEEYWLGNLGNAYGNLGEYPKAIEYHEPALNIARIIGDKENEGILLGNLGNAYRDSGEYSKAIKCYEQALSIKRVFGEKENEGILLGNLGTAYDKLGEYPRAIKYFNQSLDILHNLLAPNHLYLKTIEKNIRTAKSKIPR